MKTLILPDIHAPYHHPDTLRLLKEAKNKIKPDRVIQIGDLVDCHSLGQWDPESEHEGALTEHDKAVSFIKDLAKIFPSMTVLRGNHDSRLYKKVNKIGIPSKFVRDVPEIYKFPSAWEYRDDIVLDEVLYIHGDGYSGDMAAVKAAVNSRMNTVIGHVHSVASIHYIANKRNVIFGMSVGCLCDPNSIAMRYAVNHPKKQVLSVGAVIDRVPMIMPCY